jgi:hypothetical protein
MFSAGTAKAQLFPDEHLYNHYDCGYFVSCLPCSLDRRIILHCGCEGENLVYICDASYGNWLSASLIWSFNPGVSGFATGYAVSTSAAATDLPGVRGLHAAPLLGVFGAAFV